MLRALVVLLAVLAAAPGAAPRARAKGRAVPETAVAVADPDLLDEADRPHVRLLFRHDRTGWQLWPDNPASPLRGEEEEKVERPPPEERRWVVCGPDAGGSLVSREVRYDDAPDEAWMHGLHQLVGGQLPAELEGPLLLTSSPAGCDDPEGWTEVEVEKVERELLVPLLRVRLFEVAREHRIRELPFKADHVGVERALQSKSGRLLVALSLTADDEWARDATSPEAYRVFQRQWFVVDKRGQGTHLAADSSLIGAFDLDGDRRSELVFRRRADGRDGFVLLDADLQKRVVWEPAR